MFKDYVAPWTTTTGISSIHVADIDISLAGYILSEYAIKISSGWNTVTIDMEEWDSVMKNNRLILTRKSQKQEKEI